MTAAVFMLLAVTVAFAVADWMAVHLGFKVGEYIAKPLTMVALIGAVQAMEPTSTAARTCFVVALVFSLIGDVFLMLPDRERWFVFGLGAFLVGHLAYIPGLLLLGFEPTMLVLGLVLVGVAILTLGRHIVVGVRSKEPKLALPVTVYMSVISIMVASALGTGRVLPIAGATLFYCSDALIAWNGFIKQYAWGGLAIIITYHLAQMLLALSLI